MRMGSILGAAALAVSLALSTQARAAGRSETPCAPASFTGLRLRETAVTSAETVAGGTFSPPGARAPLTELPAFCRVRGVATPTRDSQINFELWIPAGTTWNGKLVATGNGGYSPAMSLPEMAAALRQGYAVVGGDTGHTGEDMLFGVGHPEKIVDWGTRSIHAISVSAKQLVTRQRGMAPVRSYYIGCSTGGHQGYAEVQRYPADFDGVIAGDPGANRVALNAEFLWRFLANHPTGDNQHPILDRAATTLLNRRAVEACDKLDGVEDKVIGDPRQCTRDRFDPTSLRCRDGQATDCLTAAQLEAARKIYAGPRNPRTGEQIYPGLAVGSEAGWASYWGTTEPTRADFWRYWVFDDPRWDWWTFDFDRDLATARARVGGMVDQTRTDIAAFKARGGKLIAYQGWADPVVNPLDTVAYYEAVRAAQGSQAATDDFFRLFMVPGMGHCAGGAGVQFGPPPGAPPTPANDLLSALDAWVETRHAPTQLTGVRAAGGAVTMSRPICAYPMKAVYVGGDRSKAESFRCAAG